jgi:hypothetical protein
VHSECRQQICIDACFGGDLRQVIVMLDKRFAEELLRIEQAACGRVNERLEPRVKLRLVALLKHVHESAEEIGG